VKLSDGFKCRDRQERGQRLKSLTNSWQRDLLDVFTCHADIPAGATLLDASSSEGEGLDIQFYAEEVCNRLFLAYSRSSNDIKMSE
jgi:hypothetical protein